SAKTAVLDQTARNRRLLFVAIIGAVAVCLAVAAIWVGFGKRRGRRSPALTMNSEGSAEAAFPGPLWVCPICQQEYPAAQGFCATDGAALVPKDSAPVGSQLGPERVCPICGQGFEPGVTVCPEHSEELVPRAVAGTLRSAEPASPRRICPVCGTIYGNEHQFCGNDGAALVPIN
ncbi:MAG TPA: hypothetical protein VKP30_17980, partial [Polyangiaceae bacterium]|nr:hypothetical protein [Polyangiaceae bacterium]